MPLFMLLAAFLSYSVLFICIDLTLPIFKKDCLLEAVIFLQQDQFLSQAFST